MTKLSKHFELKTNVAEILLLVIVALLFFYYERIGAYSAFRGLNLAPYMTTPFDRMIPFCAFWVVFYGITEYIIVLCAMFVRLKVGANIIFFQRMILTYVSMIIIAFILFLLLPSSVIKMFGIPDKVWHGGSLLNKYLVYVYREESPWNSNPSMHIGMSWLTFRFFAYVYKNKIYETIYLIWFLGMLIGTLCLKVHVICNLICGFILAEAAFRFVFQAHWSGVLVQWFDVKAYYKKIIVYLGIIALLLIGLHICDYYFGVHEIVNAPHATYS